MTVQMFRRPTRNDDGFSLVELATSCVIIVIIAGIAYAAFLSPKAKAKESEAYQRAIEVSASVEAYRQGNTGSVTGITSANILAGYTTSPNVTVKMCPNWSNGATATGKYTVYSYVPASAGSASALAGTTPYVFNSATDSTPAKGATTLCAAPIVV